MKNPNLIFKVFFIHSNRRLVIKHLTKVPNKGDTVRFNNCIFMVKSVEWSIDSYMTEDTGHQAVIAVHLKQVGVA